MNASFGTWALAALAASGLLLLAGYGWLRLVAWRYRLSQTPGEELRVTCEDGWELAVSYRPAQPRRFAEPVLLCHGLMANRFYFDFDPPHSVADHLVNSGFDCFTVEWRGTGASSRPPPGKRAWAHCVDDHIRYDAPAVLRLALERTGASHAFWLGHSLGALVGYAAAQHPPLARQLKGLLALGAPVFLQYGRLMKTTAQLGRWLSWPFGLRVQWLSRGLSPFIGRVVLPYSDTVVNPRNMTGAMQRKVLLHIAASVGRKTLLQLQDWAVHNAFRSFDRTVDYRAGISKLQLPLLVMGGSQDALAAPDSTRAQFELAGAKDKTLVLFGKENGDGEDYGHGDLVFGTRAPTEVYPVISRWLAAHATALPEPQTSQTADATAPAE